MKKYIRLIAFILVFCEPKRFNTRLLTKCAPCGTV
jgi:hypothetical protein